MRSPKYAVFVAFLLACTGVNAAPFAPPSASTPAIDPIANYYQKYAVVTGCSSAGNCRLTLPAITETRVLITHVSCSFDVTPSTAIIDAYLATPDLKAFNKLPVFSGAAGSPDVVYSINADTYEFFSKGASPMVTVQGSAGIGVLRCTLSGYHD
jgi:hypothetical protein